MGDELERFAENTLEYLRRERHLADRCRPTLPELGDRHAGPPRADRRARARTTATTWPRSASGYIREMRPVLIGVDGGADALLELGLQPDIIIGDFDSVSRAGAALRRAS